jgi:hypothetical protein
LGEVHAVNAPPVQQHSKLAPASPAENPKLAEALGLAAPGPESIVVSGAVPSKIHVWVAGDWSTLPPPSTARTESACSPVAIPAGA